MSRIWFVILIIVHLSNAATEPSRMDIDIFTEPTLHPPDASGAVQAIAKRQVIIDGLRKRMSDWVESLDGKSGSLFKKQFPLNTFVFETAFELQVFQKVWIHVKSELVDIQKPEFLALAEKLDKWFSEIHAIDTIQPNAMMTTRLEYKLLQFILKEASEQCSELISIFE